VSRHLLPFNVTVTSDVVLSAVSRSSHGRGRAPSAASPWDDPQTSKLCLLTKQVLRDASQSEDLAAFRADANRLLEDCRRRCKQLFCTAGSLQAVSLGTVIRQQQRPSYFLAQVSHSMSTIWYWCCATTGKPITCYVSFVSCPSFFVKLTFAERVNTKHDVMMWMRQ